MLARVEKIKPLLANPKAAEAAALGYMFGQLKSGIWAALNLAPHAEARWMHQLRLQQSRTKITRALFFEAKAACKGNKTHMTTWLAARLRCSLTREAVRKAALKYEPKR
jgi:hypothetical protein